MAKEGKIVASGCWERRERKEGRVEGERGRVGRWVLWMVIGRGCVRVVRVCE